jgi:hypothetical protein
LKDLTEKNGGSGDSVSDQLESVFASEMGLTGRLLGGFGDWLDELPGGLVVAAACAVLWTAVEIVAQRDPSMFIWAWNFARW